MKSVILLVVLAAAGCASNGAATTDPYTQGFQDGESSADYTVHPGTIWSKWRKDITRYDSEPAYRRGWDEGYEVRMTGAVATIMRQRANAGQPDATQQLEQIQQQLRTMQHKEDFRAMQRGELP
jgi:hypothetical protein